jgi:hypothetical protein
MDSSAGPVLDPYPVLGVEPAANEETVRRAHRRRVLETHPDRPGGSGAEFRRVQAAYETLSDPGSRALAESSWGARPVLTPDRLDATLRPGESRTCSVTIENRGPREAPLSITRGRASAWRIVDAPASVQPGRPEQLTLQVEASLASTGANRPEVLSGLLGAVPWSVQVAVHFQPLQRERSYPMRTIDLNELRDRILANQQSGQPRPAANDKRVFVDADGRLVPGEMAAQNPGREIAEVPQHVFAAPARLTEESAVVAQSFPRGSRLLEVDGHPGWLYSFTSELGDEFQLFAYYDQGLYFVQVVSPQVEGRYSPHDAHLFSSGVICLCQEGGLTSLRDAYAKSVLWANGFSIFQRTGRFPFSLNNG